MHPAWLLTLLFTFPLCTRLMFGAPTPTNVAQPGAQIEQLEYAETDREAYGILYEMVETMLGNIHTQDHASTVNFARKLTLTADRIGEASLRGQAYYLLARAQVLNGENRAAEEALDQATTYAMAAGDADLVLRTTDENMRLKSERRRYQAATEVSRRTLDYFIRTGDENSISRLQADLAAEKARLLRRQEAVERARADLGEELTKLTADKERLAAENKRRAEELERQMKELSKTKEQKDVFEQRATAARAALSELSREALEQQAIATEAKAELVRQELVRQEAVMHAQEQSFRLYLALGAGAALCLLAAALYSRNRVKTRAATALEAARRQSDDLLENILPAEIARELKTTGEAKVRSFPAATVLFCDFVNFTSIAAELGAEALIAELDRCFRAFDAIVDAHPGVEKIKTIGDAYMVASGLEAGPGPPVGIVTAALDMQAFLRTEATERQAKGLPFFTARMGLHTGPVVAGVVGARKFAYDIWGDTVNVASRVESAGEPGRVNVSAATQALVGEHFVCRQRGKIEAKNKGLVEMYFVEKQGEAAGALLGGN